MLRYMKFLAALFALASVRCAPAEPCSPGNEDPDEWGPTTLPSPGPGGPTDPGIDPGESDGDMFGYRRQADGDLCACDWLEHEEGGCSQDPPKACGVGVPRDIETGNCILEQSAPDVSGLVCPPADETPGGESVECKTAAIACYRSCGNKEVVTGDCCSWTCACRFSRKAIYREGACSHAKKICGGGNS